MVFPQTPLDVRVDLMVDNAWSNVTSDVLVKDSITIARGRADEAGQADPSACNLTLENRDGKFSPRNPLSSLFGKIGRNTRMRVGVGSPPISAATGGQSGTSIVAPSVTAEATGTLFCVWGAAPVGNVTGPGGFTMGTERDGALSTWASGSKSVSAGATGTSTATHSVSATGAVALSVHVPGTLSTVGFSSIGTTGAAIDHTVTGISAGDHLLVVHGWSGDPGALMNTTPVPATGLGPNWLLLADTGASSGPRVKAWIARMPTGAASSQTLRFAGPGAGLGDNHARTFRITGASDYFPRHVGEVSSWPQRWDLAGVDVRVPVTSSGILRRLGQGASPLRSSLTRYVTRAGGVVAYWPCEDAEGSTGFASPLPGVQPGDFVGVPVLAADDGFLGSDPLPTWQAAGFRGTVPTYTATGELFMGALYRMPAAGTANGANLLTVAMTGGTISRAIVEYRTGGILAIKLIDAAGATVAVSPDQVNFNVDGKSFFAWLTLVQDGADIDYRVNSIVIVDGDPTPTALQVVGTAAAHTLGRAVSVTAGIEGDSNTALSLSTPVTIGHVTVASDDQSVFRSDFAVEYPQLVARFSESAGLRVVRLCREEGIDVQGNFSALSTAMGPQRSAPLLELLRECADSDGGQLLESRGFAGLAYRSRVSRQNRSPDLTLSYSGGQVAEPFEPTDDDQATRNDWTVTRIGGGSARAELTSGALSVQPPPAGVGRYEDSVALSLYLDSQAAEEAGWRLHLGTWDEARYPSIATKLQKASMAASIPAVAQLDMLDQISVTGLPSWLPPGPAEVAVEGYTEVLAPYAWEVTFNASPAGAYRVAQVDSAAYGRLDSEHSTLAAGATSTATSLSVAVTAGSPLWITTATFPGDFPFDAAVAGEVVTVTAISGTSSPQTWTVTRSVNGIVKAQSSGAQIRLAKPTYVAK